MAAFIYEFLFRGRVPGSETPSAWHVVLGNEVDDGFGKKVIGYAGPLTPGQSQALGFSLSTILQDINGEAMEKIDGLEKDKTDLQTATARLEKDKTDLQAVAVALEDEKSAAIKARDGLATDKAQLLEQMAALTAENEDLRRQLQELGDALAKFTAPTIDAVLADDKLVAQETMAEPGLWAKFLAWLG